MPRALHAQAAKGCSRKAECAACSGTDNISNHRTHETEGGMTQLRSNAAMRGALDTRQAEEAALHQQASRCPPLPAEKLARQKPYEAKGAAPGYDGHPPKFVTAKGSEERNPATGAIIREASESQENVNASRVAYLFSRHLIEERQYRAAKKLAGYYYLSLIYTCASTVLAGAGGSGDMHPNDVKLDAATAYAKAKRAMGRFWPIIFKVVIEEKTVEKAGAEIGRPLHNSQRAMGWFDAALTLLAEHYGYE